MRRLIEIPQLDNRNRAFRAEEPRKRSWFYTLPPYVREVDLAHEVIVVSNPADRPADLSNYYLQDKGDLHRFEFEEGYILPPGADVHVFCAPGKHGLKDDDRPEHFVLWTNADGRPRKKSVLNPSGEKITLMDPNGIEVAALEVTDDEEERRRYHLYRLEMLQRGYASMVVTSSQGARLMFLVVAFVLLLLDISNLKGFVILESLAICCDLFARWIDSLRLRNSKQRIIAIIADRLEAISMLVAALLATRDELRATRLFLGLLLIEVLTSWVEVLQDTSSSPFMKTTRWPYKKKLEVFTQNWPWLIILITAGNHLFLYSTLISLAYDPSKDPTAFWPFGLSPIAQYFSRSISTLSSTLPLGKFWLLLEGIVISATIYRFVLIWSGLVGILGIAI